MLYSPAFTFSSVYSLGFGFLAGLRLGALRQFKPFWPLALVQQAPPAIILAALRRFRGAALFHGPRPSSGLGAPFWPSGLTVRRSRPPTAAAELRALGEMKWVNGLNISKTFQKKTQQTTMNEEGTVRPTRHRVISLLSLVVYKPPIKRELPS